MALTERLALLVTLDAKGAVSGFQSIGKAADQNLKKTDDRLTAIGQKATKFGAGLAGAGVIAATGLYKAGQAASDLEQAVGGTEAVFKDASGTIAKFGKDAAQNMGLSERAFREATTSIGGQLKGVGFDTQDAADQAVKLTQVAADLAATYGGTTADAVAALGSAFRGEADPAERFNLRLNQNTVNAKAVELGLAKSTASVDAHAKAQATLALIMEQSADAQGGFARESDTAAGAQARLSASLEDLKANLGSAVAPVIANVADGIGGLVEKFQSLPEPAQDAISKVATIGTVGLIAVGGVTTLVGKLLTMRDTFSDIAAKSPRVASGIGAIGKAAGVAGTILVVGEALDAAFNKDHTGNITEITNALVRLGEGAALDDLGGTLDDAVEGLGRVLDPSLAQNIDNTGERLVRSIPLIGNAIGSMAHGLQDAEEAIDGFDKGLAALAAQNPALAADALAEVARRTGIEVDAILPKLDDYRTALAQNDTAARLAAGGTEELGDAQRGLVDPINGVTTALGGQLETMQDVLDATLAQFDSNLGYRQSVESVEDAVQGLVKAQQEHGTKSEEYSDALLGVEGDLLRQASAAVRAADDVAKASGAELTAQQRTAIYRDELQKLAEKFPALKSLLQGYIDQLNRVPTKITTELVQNIQQRYKTLSAADYLNGSRFGGQRAAGGPVASDKAYLVGEKGPELFWPNANGSIVPNADLAGSVTIGDIHVHVPAGTANGAQIGADILHHIRSEVRAQGGDVQKVLGAR